MRRRREEGAVRRNAESATRERVGEAKIWQRCYERANFREDGRVPGATLSSSVQSASILRRRTNASALSRSSATNPDIARGGLTRGRA